MIYGNLKDLNQIKLLSEDKDYKDAFDYLLKGNFEHEDKKMNITDRVFEIFTDADSKPFDIDKFEAHYEHVDIHYLIEGEEDIYYGPYAEMTPNTEYKPDTIFGHLDNYQKVTLKAGDYCVLFPEEAHRPACGDGSRIYKTCIKIPTTK